MSPRFRGDDSICIDESNSGRSERELSLQTAEGQPFTKTGPMPRGRSPSLMMPRRLATSV